MLLTFSKISRSAKALVFGLMAHSVTVHASTVLFYLNTTDEGSISAAERNAWHLSLPLSNGLDFGSVTDPGTTTATDLMTQAVASTISGNSYSYVVTEGGLNNSLVFPSTILSGATPGGGLTGFGTVNFDFERPPTQNGISGVSWGYDTGSSAPNIVSSARDVLRFDFTGSITPVRSFSASLLDFESASGAYGYVTAYDVAGQLLGMYTLNFGVLDGAGEGHQFAVGTTDATNSLGYLFFTVGDNTSSIAMGDFALGSAWMVPEPGRSMLLMMTAFAWLLRRCRAGF